VEIDIYNLSGQLVKRLESGVKDAGTYSITWDGTDNTNAPASSGIYFYRLTTGNQTITKKMLLLK
jgi:flagellar basal-body rod modification protein FlgD